MLVMPTQLVVDVDEAPVAHAPAGCVGQGGTSAVGAVRELCTELPEATVEGVRLFLQIIIR